jgi:hypothetical protein
VLGAGGKATAHPGLTIGAGLCAERIWIP